MKFIKKSIFKIPLPTYIRLKGLLFQTMCGDYIKQKYQSIFCYRIKRACTKWLIEPAMDTTEDTAQLTVGYASNDGKVVNAIEIIKRLEPHTSEYKEKWKEEEFKQRQITLEHIKKAKIMLEKEKEYFKNYSFGDFVIFQNNEVHAYEFKAGKHPTFTQREKNELEKLKNSKMNVKIFILRSDLPFLEECEIFEYEY